MTSPIVREFMGAGSVASTADTWLVDGVPLSTYAMAIVTRGGSRMGVPQMRGGDQSVPGVIGQRWVAKMPDSRSIDLQFWVIGARADGTVLDQDAFHANYRALQRLLWRPGQQLTLTKRVRLPTGQYLQASAQAQYADGFDPEMTGDSRAEVSVTLNLADPFFYGPPVTFVADPGGTAVVRNRGDYDAGQVVLSVPVAASPARWPAVADAAPQQTATHLAAGHTQIVCAPVGADVLDSGIWVATSGPTPQYTWDVLDTATWTSARRTKTSTATGSGLTPPDSTNSTVVDRRQTFAGRVPGAASNELLRIRRDVDTPAAAGTRVLLPGGGDGTSRFAVTLRERFL